MPGFALDTVRALDRRRPGRADRARACDAEPRRRDTYELARAAARGFDAATLAAPMAGSARLRRHRPSWSPSWLGSARWSWSRTSRRRWHARCCRRPGCCRFFEAVHGADTPPQRKPSPLLLRQAAACARRRAGAAADGRRRRRRHAAALAAGCPAAWAGWGYGACRRRQAPADVWRLATPHELLLRLAMPAASRTTQQNTDSRRPPCPPAENPR